MLLAWQLFSRSTQKREEPVKLLFSKGTTDYYSVLDTSGIPREYEGYAERAFEAGYRHKSPGNCISEADPTNDGCDYKMRMSQDARIKPFTAKTTDLNGRQAQLLYFSIFDGNPHDRARNVIPQAKIASKNGDGSKSANFG